MSLCEEEQASSISGNAEIEYPNKRANYFYALSALGVFVLTGTLVFLNSGDSLLKGSSENINEIVRLNHQTVLSNNEHSLPQQLRSGILNNFSGKKYFKFY
jgi:hypothetical protein